MWSGIHKPLDGRRRDVQRLACVVLHPLTEIGVGMLVPVVVRCRQLVVNLQRSGKGSQHQEGQRQQAGCHRHGQAGQGTR